jgi:hypothetical protein
MADEDVNIKFGASIDDLKSKMEEVQGVFKQVTERFAVMAAVVAGGAAFKEFINETNKLNGEATKLSKTLGITATDAGTLNTALGDIGSSADEYSGAFLKFNRQLRNNSEEMKAMGVDVDALKNGQKDSNQVFQESIRLIAQYKPGVDQTQASMKLLGRDVESAQKLLKLFGGTTEETTKKLEEARKKNLELGLTITKEGLESTRAYKAAMNDVNDVMDGLKKTIGSAVIPIFTEMAEKLAAIGPTLVEGTRAAVTVFVDIWRTLQETVAIVWDAVKEIASQFGEVWQQVFGKDGPGAMEIFINALRIVQAAAIGFRIGVQVVIEAVKTSLAVLTNSVMSWAAVANRAFHLDFAGAKAAWIQGAAEQEKILAQSGARLVAIAEKGRADLDKALMTGGDKKPTTAAGAPKGGSKEMPIEDKGADAKAAAIAAARLALQKATDEASLNLQQEYLRQYQSQLDDAYKRNLISDKDYFAAKLAGELLSADASIATKRKEMEAAKAAANNPTAKPEAKLKFQKEEQELLGQINVLEAKRTDIVRANAAAYAAVEQQRMDALASISANRAKTKADAEVATERQALDQLVGLRKISADDALAIQAQQEQKSYSATLALLKAKGDAIHGSEAEALQQRAALAAEAESAEQQHQARLSQIANAAETERYKYASSIQQQAQADFATMVGAMEQGTLSVSDAFKGMGKWIERTFGNLIAQKFTEQLFDTAGINDAISSIVTTITDGLTAIIKKFLLSETQKTAAEKAGAVQRKAIQTTETAASISATSVKTEAAVAGEAVEGEAAVAGAEVKIAADETASGASIAATAASAIANIAAKAWEVAASVYSALAGIPYVGPFIAPVAAIAATAVVLGFIGRIASSEGGEMQVGEDRLNFVHKDETILPAPFASGLRELVGKGSVGQIKDGMAQILDTLAPTGARPNPQGQPPVDTATPTQPPGPGQLNPGTTAAVDWWRVPENPLSSLQRQAQNVEPVPAQGRDNQRNGGDVHLHVDAVDGASVKRLFMEHGRSIASSLQNQARNFKPKK